ncbi:hypothetical protein HW532_15875 [Kaustia mangrovi]|uniref:DUF2158 domain-containing protein n=1 Tax=Kaustia mangrovi TaxID=2593653 RepID=A0A7S8HCX6_9HYPH|nr:hypothetical protein [Kaustia mangrovi]QPC44040.1 hypothetical protein HW532_15875 [Kaustia mangrovi]
MKKGDTVFIQQGGHRMPVKLISIDGPLATIEVDGAHYWERGPRMERRVVRTAVLHETA